MAARAARSGLRRVPTRFTLIGIARRAAWAGAALARTRDGTAARKRFGQHFLVDRAVVDAIVRAVDPRPGDRLIEIGPGRGALTGPLVAALGPDPAFPLEAIEIDRDLAPRLQARFGERLVVHRADALEFDFGAGQRPRLVGNLPYNISSPLLVHASGWSGHLIDQHFMLQREVAERIVAAPGPDFGRLTVVLQNRYHALPLFDVPPEAFDPPPRVQSTVIRMVPRSQPLTRQVAMLERLLTIAFGQRRKMLRATLGRWLAAEAPAFDLAAAAAIDPRLEPLRDDTRRAETIGVDCWCALADRLDAGQGRSISSIL